MLVHMTIRKSTIMGDNMNDNLSRDIEAAIRRKETIRKVLYALLATGFIVIAIMLYLYDVPMQN
jgi:hypothetical protein